MAGFPYNCTITFLSNKEYTILMLTVFSIALIVVAFIPVYMPISKLYTIALNG